ncbi:bifunctional diguanylate cyclase/phosphodiesterase [Streptomyces sp. NBC_00140]|uniref:putative bifunctional diguanylate cyclase/phosphodiesterase n=1 Tax=Streptomyces sp. NBC_00140 TaxID=2975664 RepID=UPI002B1D60FE|nr:bifunctional diguanylate cyclase/phosphodiesterase [Streptomyces sp. NBC_00140]
MRLLLAHRLMVVYVMPAAGAIALYMTVPSLRTPMWVLVSLGGAAAVLAGVHVNRPAHRWPWLVFAAGLVALAAGDTYYNVQEQYSRASVPFPSPADACHLAVYPLLAVGLFGLVRYRWVDRDWPSLLDASIITAGLALPVWVYLVQPLTVLEGLTWEQRAIGIAYPLGDVLVLAMLVRLLVPGPHCGRERSLQLLALGTVALVGFDIAYGILRLDSSWEAGTVMDSGWIVFSMAWGLAALHPSMRGLTEPERRPLSPFPPWRRLVLLAAAMLVVPLVLLLEERSGTVNDVTAPAAFSSLLFVLVILRLADMIVAHRKSVARELTLRMATASLVAAEGAREIEQSCNSAVTALFGPKVRHASMLLSAQQALWLYTLLARSPVERRNTGSDGSPQGARNATALSGTLIVTVPELGPDIAGRLGDLPAALVCPMAQPDRPTGGELPGILLAAGPEQQLIEIRGTLEILASYAGLAAERVVLRREISRKESEAYFRTLVHNASDVILILNDDTTVRYASPSAEAVFGSAALTGTALQELVDARDRGRVHRTLTVLRSNKQEEAHDHWCVLKDGSRIEVEVRCRDLRQDRTVGGLVITLRDVTEQRQLEHELTQRAFHDPLTGLPNRTLLLERTERALLRGRRESTLTCLLFIDLDDFKIVNDTLGHSVGDQLLTTVGERLSRMLRRTDTAARLGGDEFAVLMEGARQPVDAEVLAAQVVQGLNRPFRLSDDSVNVSASVGVATAWDSADPEELLALADLALYSAKSAGKRQWRRFQPDLRDNMAARHDLRARLDRAIADEEISLLYQPVVDITVGEVVGFEALARWPHSRRGMVPPLQFIALAEETGQITPLGAWVLRNAVAGITRLQNGTPRPVPPPYVSVNVSARQFQDTGFLNEVRRSLDTAGLHPGSLQLELTESVLMRRDDHIDALLGTLKDLGVRIAVDDFGTGFSSLRYLREFPIDVLKIDKTFIDDIPEDPKQVALVEGILHLADRLGLQVIAEGIEEQAQSELLASLGCRFGQGYLFAPPMNLEESEVILCRPDADPPSGTAAPQRPADSSKFGREQRRA